MLRTIIRIDEEKCNGCGACAEACHEGAIAMIDGKAKLIRDDYCDGLGHCLPCCPVDALSFEEREALAYDEIAVQENMANKQVVPLACGCPGQESKKLSPTQTEIAPTNLTIPTNSQLMQWPVQIALVPLQAEYFHQAKLLIAADCTAYAYGNFHQRFMKNHVTIIGCPKLDTQNYQEKLTEILKRNEIQSVTVLRMEVPCCGGIEQATVSALKNCGKFLPWQVVTITTDGKIKGE